MFDAIPVFNGFQSRQTRVVGRIASLLMLGLWLAAITFSSSIRLHGLVCADSQQASHDCLLTSFAKSHFLPLSEPVSVSVATFVAGESYQAVSQEPVPSADVRLAPGRAPPSFFILR